MGQIDLFDYHVPECLPWQRGKDSALKKGYLGFDTKQYLMVKFQFWKSGECEVGLHFHYSLVHTKTGSTC